MAKRLAAAMQEIKRDIKRVKKITGKTKAQAKKRGILKTFLCWGVVRDEDDIGPYDLYTTRASAAYDAEVAGRVVRVKVEVME